MIQFISWSFEFIRRAFSAILPVICLCYILSATAEEPLDELFFSHLNDDGVSVGTIESIIQDKYGYMWFGGSEGLVRFDGYNYTTYRNKLDDDRSLSSNIVWDLMEDHDGRLWVATDGGLNVYERATDTFIRYLQDDANPNSLPVNATRSLSEDSAGNIWIATTDGLAKLDPSRSQFTIYRHQENQINSLSHSELRRVYVGRDGKTLWIGNYISGLNSLDTETGEFTRFPSDVTDGTGLNFGTLNAIFEDAEGFIWLGTDGAGLNRYNPETGKFIYFTAEKNTKGKLRNNVVTRIIADKSDQLWIATEGGLHYLNRDTFEFKHYYHNAYKRHSLQASNIHGMVFDSSNDLWLGHFPAGVSYLDTSNMMFRTYRHDPADKNSLNAASVLSIQEFPENILWLGTDGGALNKFDLSTGRFVAYPPDPNQPDSINAPAVLSIAPAGQDKFWLGTWHGGVNLFDAGTEKAKHFQNDAAKPGSLSNDNVWSLILDDEENLWAGTIGGGISLLRKGKENFEIYQKAFDGDAGFYVVWKVFQDSNKDIWAGTNQGLGKLNREKNIFEFYRHDSDDMQSLSFDVVVDIAEDNLNRLWIATRGGGLNLFDRKTEKFKNFREQDGLPSDVIRSVAADNIGNLWLGSDKGLTKFNLNEESYVTYTEHNGLQGNSFNFSAALRLSSGDMAFGGTNGVTIFNPEELKESNSVPLVDIVDFQIFNKPVPILEAGSPLKKSINLTEHIVLDYHQTVFSFSFTALSFRDPQKNTFAYKMEGFDNEWNYVDASRRNVTYTNLDAGNYVFKVKAANNEGVWNEQPRQIRLVILPPPWRTWWAYSIYTVIGLSILLSVYYRQIRKRRQAEEQSRLLELTVAERTQELRRKNRDIEAMLGNMRQGLFTVEEDGHIHGEYSRFLEEIFETSQIAGKQVVEFLFEHTELSQDKRDQIKASVFSILGEDALNFMFNAHLLPAEYELSINGKIKHLALDWSPLESDDGDLKVMVTVRDITRLKKAQAEAVKQQRELTMVGQLIKITGTKFHSFSDSFESLLQQCETLLNHAIENKEFIRQEDKELLFRNMHTIKGNSRTLGLTYLSDTAHIVESSVVELQKSNSVDELVGIESSIDKLRGVLQEYTEVFRQILGREAEADKKDDEGFWLKKDTVEYVQRSLSEMEESVERQELKRTLSQVNYAIQLETSATLDMILEDVVNSLPSIARELDKQAPKVIFSEGNVRFLPDAASLLQNVFTHLLRNSLDHGIECDEERKLAGKPLHGLIELTTELRDGKANISLKDDGKGLNLRALLDKGKELQVFYPSEIPDQRAIVELIFKSGVSTKEDVSVISGRGVGMDAVKTYLKEKHGDILVNVIDESSQDDFLPFELIVVLPDWAFIEVDGTTCENQ